MTRRNENDPTTALEPNAGQVTTDPNPADGVKDDVKTPSNPDGIRYFDTTIVKLVKDSKTGDLFEVMSDHLAPGEKLKSEVDAEKAKAKADKAAKALKDSLNK